MTIKELSLQAIKKFQKKNCELGCELYSRGISVVIDGYPQCTYPGSPLKIENGICLYRKECNEHKETDAGTN